MSDSTTQAWATGVFEGEGSIIWTPGPPPRRQIVMGMTDRDVVERVQAAFATGRVHGPYTANRFKPFWQWRVGRWPEIEQTLRVMLPWLGDRRREAAERLLANPAAYQGGSPRKELCLRGHPFDSINTYVDPAGNRQCRACNRIRAEQRRRKLGRPVRKPRGLDPTRAV